MPLRTAARTLTPDDEQTPQVLAQLDADLTEHHRALLTGAEAEQIAEGIGEGADEEGSAPIDPDAPGTLPRGLPSAADAVPPPAVPGDVPGLVAALIEVRGTAAAGATQCSGRMARLLAAIACSLTFTAGRLHEVAAVDAELPGPPEAEDIVTDREVPSTDPPLVAAREDLEAALEQVTADEWYAGYALEVLAARREDEARESLLRRSEQHRTAAARLVELAEAEDLEPVVQQPVYPLPDGGADEEVMADLPRQISLDLLPAYITLVGAATFDHRATGLDGALREAHRLAGVVGQLAALPSYDPEE
ncbi:MAG: DUF4439 domain-containing protein [Brachybacterium sp.]|nr:DUF4439 domain-containing protein [Brachybacterium sp.]